MTVVFYTCFILYIQNLYIPNSACGIYLSIYLSVYLSIYLSVCQSSFHLYKNFNTFWFKSVTKWTPWQQYSFLSPLYHCFISLHMDQVNESFLEVPIESWLACVGFEPTHGDFVHTLLLTELSGHDFESRPKTILYSYTFFL